ncbi:hypothetical protein Hanom_Chr00s000001g01595651 [Helianthus anomalus]
MIRVPLILARRPRSDENHSCSMNQALGHTPVRTPVGSGNLRFGRMVDEN